MLYRGVLWKEWREQAAILVALVVMGGGVIATVATFSGPSGEDRFDLRALSEPARLTVLMLALTAGTVVGGSLFAGEDEAGTSAFLGFLPATRWRVWRAKTVAGFILAVVSGGLLILIGVGVGAFGTGNTLTWAWIGIAGVIAAYGWGTVGSTISRSTLAACGLGIIAAGFSGIALLFGLALVAEIFLDRANIQDRQVGVFYAYPYLMTVLPYILSGFIYTRPDRARRAEETTPGTVVSTVRTTRLVGRTRSGFGVRGLLWLMYRQYRVAVFMVGAIAVLAGLVMLIDDAPMMAGWPAVTTFVGVLAGVIGWSDEQGRGTSLYWGERRIPGGRLWLAKVAAGFGLTLFWCLLFYLPSFVRAVVDEMTTPAWSAFRCGFLPQDASAIGLLAVWPVYGFACGHLAGMLFEKAIVAAGTALLTALATAALWFPSFVAGGANEWHWALPPLALFAVARLLMRPWAGNRVATRRPLDTLVIGLATAVLLIAAGAYHRATEVPEIPESDDDIRFAATVPTYDENEAGRDLRTGVLKFQTAARDADQRFDRPFRPLFPNDPESRSYRELPFSHQLHIVLRNGWPVGRPDFDQWMDSFCAADADGGWEDPFFSATRRPPGSLMDLTLTNLYTPGTEIYSSQRIVVTLLARGLQLQARGDPEAFVRRLDAALCLARSMRFKSPTTSAATGRSNEAICFATLDRWLERLDGRPDLLRRAADLLTRHEAAVHTDWNEAWLAERTIVRSTVTSPALWAEGRMRGVHIEMHRNSNRSTAGLDERIKAESGVIGFVAQVPWERERQRRLIGLGNDPNRQREVWDYSGGAELLSPFPVRNLSFDEKPYRAASRAAALRAALRAYQADNGRMPDSLDQLVPKYLLAVPTDPFDGKPFRYRVSAGESIAMELIQQPEAVILNPPGQDSFVVLGQGEFDAMAAAMGGLVRWPIEVRQPPGLDPPVDDDAMDAVAAVAGAVVQWPFRPLTAESVALDGQFPESSGMPFVTDRRRPATAIPQAERREVAVAAGQAVVWAVGEDMTDDSGTELLIGNDRGRVTGLGDRIYIVPPPPKPSKK